jgi:hypothetical protein
MSLKALQLRFDLAVALGELRADEVEQREGLLEREQVLVMSCCNHWQSSTSDLRPETFFTWRALTSSTVKPRDSSNSYNAIQYTPVFGPTGGHVEGAQKVWSTHERGAEQFHLGGENKLEILHMGASDGIAYWVGLQHAIVHMGKSAKATPMSLRVTEVFRREDDEWEADSSSRRHAGFRTGRNEN